MGFEGPFQPKLLFDSMIAALLWPYCVLNPLGIISWAVISASLPTLKGVLAVFLSSPSLFIASPTVPGSLQPHPYILLLFSPFSSTSQPQRPHFQSIFPILVSQIFHCMSRSAGISSLLTHLGSSEHEGVRRDRLCISALVTQGQESSLVAPNPHFSPMLQHTRHHPSSPGVRKQWSLSVLLQVPFCP